ncbi:MAG: ABC transporter transmembrane domain-containing protein [Oscillospiraceae bacterium]
MLGGSGVSLCLAAGDADLLPLGLYRTFFAIMAALLAAYLLKAVFKYAVTVIGHHSCGVLIEADMRQELFEHLQTMSFRFFDCNRTACS